MLDDEILKDQASLSLKFDKACKYKAMIPLNSLDGVRWVSVNLPDHIDIYIEHTFINSCCTQRVRDVCNQLIKLPNVKSLAGSPGHFVIPAKEGAIHLLNLLIKATEAPLIFEISKKTLDALLEKLIQDEYLTAEDAQRYRDTIKTEYTLADKEQDAIKNRDANLALDIAKIFQSGSYNITCFFPSHLALIWLTRAKHYQPNHGFFQNEETVLSFLKTLELEMIRGEFLFFESKFLDGNDDDVNQYFLGLLAQLPGLTTINFNARDSVDSKLLGKFLSQSRYIHTVKLDGYHLKMDVSELAIALSQNTSIKHLGLHGQPLKQGGLKKIVNALKQNPQHRLERLNLWSSAVDDEDFIFLLEYLKTSSTLTLESVILPESRMLDKLAENKHYLERGKFFYFQPDFEKRDTQKAFDAFELVTADSPTEYGEAQFYLALLVSYCSEFTPQNFGGENKQVKHRRLTAMLPFLERATENGNDEAKFMKEQCLQDLSALRSIYLEAPPACDKTKISLFAKLGIWSNAGSHPEPLPILPQEERSVDSLKK